MGQELAQPGRRQDSRNGVSLQARLCSEEAGRTEPPAVPARGKSSKGTAGRTWPSHHTTNLPLPFFPLPLISHLIPHLHPLEEKHDIIDFPLMAGLTYYAKK